MGGQAKDSENGPVLDLQQGNWWERISRMAQRVADRVIPGSSEMEEPALVPIAAPGRPKRGA